MIKDARYIRLATPSGTYDIIRTSQTYGIRAKPGVSGFVGLAVSLFLHSPQKVSRPLGDVAP